MDGIRRPSTWLLGSGLSVVSQVYARRGDGVLVYRGERPGPGWVIHGWLKRSLWTLHEGERLRERVHKQRWRHVSGATCHSRPPDDVAQVHSCSLIVVLSLWAWLASGHGAHRYEAALRALDERPSRRTVQRWLARAAALTTSTHQILRHAFLERGEPRPMKHLFRSGLSPPGEDDRRRWRDAPTVGSLQSALTIVVDGARLLDVPLPMLLAEARGRCARRERFLL